MSIKVSKTTKLAHQNDAHVKRLLEGLKREGLLRPGMRVGVAVSGGADSVALLLLLLEIREKLGIVISVVHFNHKLRGRASDADERFVEKLAAKYGLAFLAGRSDVAAKALREKANLEDAARRARYAFFEKMVSRSDVDRIAVGHTADDQAETVLAHILRGTGITGLGGIHPRVGYVIRPLLGFRRRDLRAYLKSRKQVWREDASNRDTSRLRARIRKKILPLLEKQFQIGVVEHLASLAELAREDEALLESIVEEKIQEAIKEEGGTARICIEDLLTGRKDKRFNTVCAEDNEKRAEALAKRMIRRIVRGVKKRDGEIGLQHVEAVLDMARHGENGKKLSLPGGVEVRRERDALVFVALEREGKLSRRKNPEAIEFEYNIDMAGGEACAKIPEIRCGIRLRMIDWPAKRGETSDRGAVLDRERLRWPLVVRNWRPGDRLQPVGHANAHKLKRLLNEKRISRWERDGWPVLTSGGVVAWARGFSVAAEFAASERTQAGIVIAEEKL
jgi:tRNA(Ile)-lysidine synthase